MPVSFKVIRKPIAPVKQINTMRQEVLRVAQPVVKRYIARKHQATSKFTHKPQYESRIFIRATAITFTVILKNARDRVGKVTLATLLNWLYKTGTKAHLIRAKTARFLAFAGGPYSRKTEGGNGSSGGPVIYRQEIGRASGRERGFSLV